MIQTEIRKATPRDVDAVETLLRECGLPADGWRDHLENTLVATAGSRIVGTAALEMYGKACLLRSVATSAMQRGHGVASRLTNAALDLARERDVQQVFLLTNTADAFFSRLGFVVVDRAQIPATVKTSVEFTSACCASARAMRVPLVGT
jgi:amino-acid N-acetyltransferase